MNRAPNASTFNKAAKDATLQRVRNAKDDIIAIINRRMQRANFYPVEPDVALADAARIGYRIDVTATFNRESDNFVIDALTMSPSDLARYFGRGTSKNLSVTVQIIRPQRELVGNEYQRVQAREQAPAIPQEATDPEVMYREVINQVIDTRQAIIDAVNAELPAPLGTEEAINLAARQGYVISINVEYGNTPTENHLDALTMSNELIWTNLVYNHIADYAVSWNVEMVVPTTGARLEQNFQEGIANCMLEPLMPTAPYSLTHFSNSGMQVAGSTPGDCGSMATGTKCSGNKVETRKHNSLQIAAQVEETWKSPMWCAMNEARGENKVTSLPRSFINRNWLVSMLWRKSSSLIFNSDAFGMFAGSWMPAIWRLRQSSKALGAVV